MITRFILLAVAVFIMGSSLPVFSQTIVTGKVMAVSRNSLPDITVVLMNSVDSVIIDHCLTDEKGEYRLSSKGTTDTYLLISISSFDIKRQTKKIENRSQTVNFVAEEGSIALEEVVVKAKKMWGKKDTINYRVSVFKDKSDLVIGDVLKRMPGIDVKESGQITYKGKPINKFYIENLDMLEGRYGIATNNISASDIATVQVLENHQPIKALEKTSFSNDAAINLNKRREKRCFQYNGSVGHRYG